MAIEISSKDLAPVIGPLATTIVNTLVKPKLDQLSEWLKKQKVDRAVVAHRLSSKFEEYLTRSYEQYRILNTMVFPNRQIDIRDLYVPVTLVSESGRSKLGTRHFDFRLFERYRKVLVSDAAGMGKSTLARSLCLDIMEQRTSIPVLIELRKLREGHSLLDEVFAQIDPLSDEFNRDLLLRLIDVGEFVFFFDGYDEVAPNDQETIATQIREFSSKAGQNLFVMTSRPEASLATFGDFQRFSIAPLSLGDATTLFNNLDKISGQALTDKLLAELDAGPGDIRDFLRSPFLSSLLYKSYSYNHDIPKKKRDFYDEVYLALYKAHDLTKDAFRREKLSGLDVQDFRVVVRRIAFDTAVDGKVEYSLPELMAYIHKAQTRLSTLEFGADAFLSDLILSVPLFFKDGSAYRWAHKSFQDYFAAEHVVHSKSCDEFLNIVYERRASRLLNILDFISEIDFPTYRRVIIGRFLGEFIEYVEHTYADFLDLRVASIRNRQSATFGVRAEFTVLETPSSYKKFDEVLRRFDWQSGSHAVFMEQSKRTIVVSFEPDFRGLLALRLLGSESLITRKTRLSPGVSTGEVRIALPITEGTYYPVTDERTNVLNSRSVFDLVTHVLLEIRQPTSRRVRNSAVVFDYERCLEVKKQLDLEELEGGLSDDLQSI